MTGIFQIELSDGAAEYLMQHEFELRSFASNPLSTDLQPVVERGMRRFETCIYMAHLGEFDSADYYHPVKDVADCTFSEHNFNKLHLMPLNECEDEEDELICGLAQGFKLLEALRFKLPDTEFPVDMMISGNHENVDLDMRSCVFRLYQSRSEEHQWPQPGDIEGTKFADSFVLVVRFPADRDAEAVDVLSAVMTEAKQRATS